MIYRFCLLFVLALANGPLVPFSFAAAKDDAAPVAPALDEPPIVEGLAHYIVYKEPREGTVKYSTFQFPELGYLATAPDFVVTEIKSVKLNKTRIVTKDKPQQPMRQTLQDAISITLLDDDKAKLHAFSKKATGQRVLIVVDGRPVSAPVIMAPIESGEVTISGGRLTRESVNRIFADLEKRQAP
jgi:hypothetical protein